MARAARQRTHYYERAVAARPIGALAPTRELAPWLDAPPRAVEQQIAPSRPIDLERAIARGAQARLAQMLATVAESDAPWHAFCANERSNLAALARSAAALHSRYGDAAWPRIQPWLCTEGEDLFSFGELRAAAESLVLAAGAFSIDPLRLERGGRL